MSSLEGKRLGQYHLLEVIRQSGMATVYKGYQPSLDRAVAIKVMAHAQDAQFAARFQREAKAIGQLEHHNILPIYDYGEQDGVLFFVMQYVENGATLRDLLGAPLEPGRAVRLMGQALTGLDYAHTRGVIHRDIKPSNILMPLPHWPLLADFGLAKFVDDKHSLTMPGLVVGTAAYMAPEQASGEPADARTDIYAMGVVLYELLTGRVPFDADTPVAMLKKHAHEPPPPPRSINPNLSAELETVLLRALEKDPVARYQSAAAMMVDLKPTTQTGRLHAQTQAQYARLYEAGVQAFAEAAWDRAIERLRQLVALDPHYEDAAALLAAAQTAQQRARTEARQQLEQLRQRRRAAAAFQAARPAHEVAVGSQPGPAEQAGARTPGFWARRWWLAALVIGGLALVVLVLALRP